MFGKLEKIKKNLILSRYNNIIKSSNNMMKEYENFENQILKEKFIKLKSDSFSKYDEAITIIRILSDRFLGLKPFQSQIKGALVLKDGYIAEMKTGEGKTLSTTIALLINYLSNKNAHIVTANEYLVKRDFLFSEKLFNFLEVKSFYLENNLDVKTKKIAYESDVLYSTSKLLIYDYLYNNNFKSKELIFNEKRDFVIVDEIDFILIDEARTPISIAGSLASDVDMYINLQELQKEFIGAIKDLEDQPEDPDFIYNDDNLEITEKGYNLLEKKLIESKIIEDKNDLYGNIGLKYIRNIEKTLRANYLFKKNINYFIKDDEAVIIDSKTGRAQPTLRYSNGLHQMIEAKEGLKIKEESKTMAQTTIQNYFKKYKKISGTTGTALSEETEFNEFYFMKVLPIETNKKLIRIDSEDLLFLNKKAMKYNLLIDIKNNIQNGQPSLIGVLSVEDSEDIANMLKDENINFEVLDAKNNEREAYIIEQAGKSGAVTVATNMAGRGTDIMLGGNKDIEIKRYIEENPEATEDDAFNNWKKQNNDVINSGGLSIMGIGRNFSRRLDDQLIGRAGRQGDPGFTKFYITLEDPIFANMSTNYLKSQWSKENELASISAKFISNIIKSAQKNYDNRNFHSRKTLLRFDNINTEQREIFYGWRRKVVLSDNLENIIKNYFYDTINSIVDINFESNFNKQELEKVENNLLKELNLDINLKDLIKEKNVNDLENLKNIISNDLYEKYKEKTIILDKKDKNLIEKDLLLRVMDINWSDNISDLEEMRISTSLRSYAQKNPLEEYQKEAYLMFQNLIIDIKKDFCNALIKFSPLSLLESKKEKEKEIENEILKRKEIEMNYNNLNPLPMPLFNLGI